MVKRELTVGGLICHLASEMHFHSQKKNRVNYFFRLVKCSPVQFLFGIWSQVLCCPISIVSDTKSPRGKRPEHLHFPNKTNCRCAQIPNNSCTSAVGTKSFPAPVSNIACSTKLCSIFATPTKICTRGWSIWGSRHQLRSHPHTTSTSGTLYFLKVFPRPPKE